MRKLMTGLGAALLCSGIAAALVVSSRSPNRATRGSAVAVREMSGPIRRAPVRKAASVRPTRSRDDWAMSRHDAQNTAQSPFPGPRTPRLKWKFTTGGYAIGSSPVIGRNGTIYVATENGPLYAINPDGSQKWVFQNGGSGWASPAVATDGTVYVISINFGLYAVNPDGSKRWAFAHPDCFTPPTIGSDGTIYVVGDKVYAIRPDGSKKWEFHTGYRDAGTSPTLALDGTIYIAGYGPTLYALRPDGSKKWIFRTRDGADDAPAIGRNGTVYLPLENRVYAIAPDGSKKWVFRTGDYHLHAPAVASDGAIYVESDDKLYALRPNGSKKWQLPIDDLGSVAPVITSDGTVYVGTHDQPYTVYAWGGGHAGATGKLYAINPDGTKKWEFPAPRLESAAIGADGTVYLVSEYGEVYAIGSRAGSRAGGKSIHKVKGKHDEIHGLSGFERSGSPKTRVCCFWHLAAGAGAAAPPDVPPILVGLSQHKSVLLADKGWRHLK